MNDSENPVDMVACGVLAVDLKHIAEKLGIPVRLHFLPGGLHAAPDHLRRKLQKTIDEISRAAASDRIVIGYGVCGRGTVGLHARGIPLVIPRVHDCIALFLGSVTRYREQFASHPGTYYLSAGWVEEKSDEGPRPNMGSDSAGKERYATYEQLMEAYGTDNADYIRSFMQSWTRHYTRAAFIDTGVGDRKERYAQKASEMAGKFNWEYARLTGTHDLLIETLTTRETSNAILVVPPHAVTRYDAMHCRLDADSPERTPNAVQAQDMQGMATSPPAATTSERHGIGLGIDTGGTYTDAVLYDFDRNEVRSKSKTLTTHWDYRVGIREALARLDPPLLAETSLAAVSTTIATNAIVEDRGQAVGLLVMPPCGWKAVEGFRHRPLEIIDGQLEINGTEVEPINEDQVRRVALDLVARAGVTAFAVGGYAAHANPDHELQVKAIIQQATGMSVTCSHALSTDLHYRIRAETAALNARIIPCLEALLTHITGTLESAGVHVPVMVVRSDGSFMNINAALERPLETMLSGPAASAAGAGWLAQVSDGLVADIGGTTTDTAILKNGQVRMNAEGATIGGWQTHVRALDLQTAGLGGDSFIHFRDQQMLIGPERVVPVSWLAANHRGTATAMDWIEARLESATLSSNDSVLLVRTAKHIDIDVSEGEQAVLERLEERPYSLHELTAAMGKPHPSMVPLRRLIGNFLVQRGGFTPTDALHAAGRIALWDQAAAIRMATLQATQAKTSPEQWVQRILTRFERTLAAEILKKQISETTAVDQLDKQPLALALMDRILDHDETGFSLDIAFRHPVIGIGAPASCFIPDACARLRATPIIPLHAEVANAVGAVIGTIRVRHHVTITTSEKGRFRIGGIPEAPAFETLEEATAQARTRLRHYVAALARRAGCSHPQITLNADDSVAPAADGSAIFISRTLEGHATGAPDR